MQSEEVELDEAVKVGDTVNVKLNRKGREYIEKGKVIKIEKDSIIVKHDFSRTPSKVSMKNIVKEEVDLDEGKMKDLLIKGQDLEAYAKKHGGIDKKDMMKVAAMLKKGDKSGALKYTMKLDTDPKEYILSLMGEIGEDAELVGVAKKLKKASQAHAGQADTIMKHVKDMQKESAAADARRAMRRDPEMRQKGFSKDISATDDDEKAASKNIMMQMRKAQSLKGRFDVEFQDGKKVKIPVKIAVAVQQKYNAMRKPADKEKFQSKVAKSYKDMLRALKEQGEAPAAATPDYKAGGKAKADEYRQKAKQMVGTEGFASDAQRRAAFASGYKEKGKKKKESVLDRIDNKLKERKNG